MKEKILVVDDDELLLRSVTILLWKENYIVTSVNNGEEALKKIEQENFDLVILDIRMPGVGGVQVLNKMRELQKGKRERYVIVMTGYASEDVPIKAIKLGVIDYIMKPFETSDFLFSINRAMKMIKLTKEQGNYLTKLEEANKKLLKANTELKKLR